MATVKNKNKSESRRILAFNAKKRLAMTFASRLQAAKALDCRTQLINNACDGQLVTLKGFYFRWWDETIEIDTYEELGKLKMAEYDDLAGIDRVTEKPKHPKKKSKPKTNKRRSIYKTTSKNENQSNKHVAESSAAL